MSDITGTLTINGKTYRITGVLADGSGGGGDDELPPLPSEYQTRMFRLGRCGSKSGESARGKWTRFWAKDELEDSFIATFDTNLGAELKKIVNAGKEVRLAYVDEGEGNFLFVGYPASEADSRKAAAPAPAKPAARPAAGGRSAYPGATTPSGAAKTKDYDPDSDELPM